MAKPHWKDEAAKHWTADPCGGVDKYPFGSREFFAAVEHERYGLYAPWLLPAMNFEAFEGRRVLEVGYGLGTDHLQIARRGAMTFGVDLSTTHAQATQLRFRQAGNTSRIALADAEELPFQDNAFDAAYSFGVLHHTPDTCKALREIYRVLRPGGEVICGLYHRDSAFFWYWTVLIRGMRLGGFWQKGYRRTLSEVEARKHSNAVPLVKVYSRWGARRLFEGYQDIKIQTFHFEFAHLGLLGRLLRSGGWAERQLQWLGWYLLIRARKPTLST